MAAEGMPPPLEDMTATLEQAKKLRALRLGAHDHPTYSHSSTGTRTNKTPTDHSSATVAPAPQNRTQTTNTTKPAGETTKSTKSTPNDKSSSKDFGGMKKGFLFGGSGKKQQTKTESKKSETVKGTGDASPQEDSIPFIKAKAQDKESGLKLDEVQKAMESTKGFLQDKEWVTDDLLEKVQKNETLSKRLGDPRFMQAVTEFQTNPKEAMVKYQGNPEMQQFLKEFCGILGAHFTALGDKQEGANSSSTHNPSKPPDRTGPKIIELTDEDSRSSVKSQESNVPVDPHVQQILADPANREILMDPKVQQLIQHLRSDPEKAQRMLREGDSNFRQKVDRLISLGLLKLQA